MSRVDGEPALVLHTRTYRETSVLIDLLTLHHGRVAALHKGGRKATAKRPAPRLQVFTTFQATWFGRGQLVTLATPRDPNTLWLEGQAAAAGLYINELLVRLLQERAPMPTLFAAACWALEQFATGQDQRPALRSFEKILIESLGYGFSFSHTVDTRLPISEQGWYEFAGVQGFVALPPAVALTASARRAGFDHCDRTLKISGAMIRAIYEERFEDAGVAAAARRLFRLALLPLLGQRPLRSRELVGSSLQLGS